MSKGVPLGSMTGNDFRRIRHGLLLTQREMAQALGYAQKVRISEYERNANPVPIPLHIQQAMLEMYENGGLSRYRTPAVREWNRRQPTGGSESP